MNKRIKNKVTKRIINKMQSKNSLTEFEKKFFDKHLCDSFSNIATEFLDSFILVMTRWLEYEKKKVEEQIAELDVAEKNGVEQAEWLGGIDFAEGPDMTVHSVKEPTEVERFQNAINAMNNFGSQLNPESPAPVEEPGKWNKLKVKVKGWFGK